MGFFDFITNIFSKSDKGKPKKKKKKTAKKKAIGKAGTKKKVVSKSAAKEKTTAKPPAKKKVAAKSGTKKKKKKTAIAASASKKPAKQTKLAAMLPFSLDKSKGKKRKKSQKITADPIDEQALGFSISLKGDDEHAKKRNALRIDVKGLKVHIHRLKKQFKVTDISATGLGFAFDKPRIKSGVKLEMDIYLNGQTKASSVVCKVMRHTRGSVGCVFEELDRAQDDAVHEIVLLGQKQQSDKKNFMKDREFKLPE